MKPGAAVRARAASAVAAVMSGESLDRALESQPGSLAERDRSLYRELSFGTLRQFPRLNALLSALLDKPLRNKDRDIHALALLGLYQLTHMRIPAHAAVSATVDAASVLRKRQASGLLNAVLRRYQREEGALLVALGPAELAAHPDWLWEALGESWPQQREQIAQANNSHPPMTLRVSLGRTDRSSYAKQLEGAGIVSSPGKISPAALTLQAAADVTQLPGFDQGLCSVQDEAAQLAAILLDPRPGEKILDACAAPGGKTGHILELQPQLGELTAMDISPQRLQRLQDNLDRLQLSATVLAGDGATPDAALLARAPFDAILLDAPCSATGVIRRHPDIKLLRREEDVAGFAKQQLDLLRGLWPLLAPGGRLLYVSCSVLREENAELIEQFLGEQADCGEVVLSLKPAERCPRGVQLLPDPQGSDGLYFALLRKPQ